MVAINKNNAKLLETHLLIINNFCKCVKFTAQYQVKHHKVTTHKMHVEVSTCLLETGYMRIGNRYCKNEADLYCYLKGIVTCFKNF